MFFCLKWCETCRKSSSILSPHHFMAPVYWQVLVATLENEAAELEKSGDRQPAVGSLGQPTAGFPGCWVAVAGSLLFFFFKGFRHILPNKGTEFQDSKNSKQPTNHWFENYTEGLPVM